MRLGHRAAITLLGVLTACEIPDPMLGDAPDAGDGDGSHHEHEHDASMDGGHEHDDGGAHHDAGDDAGSHAGFGLHTRPTNVTCVAPDYAAPDADGGVQELMPQWLSETGCFEASDPSQPTTGLISFELNSALWSDGASKRRWMALPSGSKIKIVDGGDFEFPPGTMLVKEFSIGGRRLETRFFAHHPVSNNGVPGGQWVGYTYQWNAQQTDAELVARGPTDLFDVDPGNPGLGQWRVPTRDECMTCHTVAAGRSLGPEIAQLNGNHTYETTGTSANQLATLDHIGMFTEKLASVDTLNKLADPSDESLDLELRARAYLHANCSFCHRKPDGIGGGPDEFRAAIPFEKMGICDVRPTIPTAIADLGMDDTGSKVKILAHGSHEDSILWKRMEYRPTGASVVVNRQMPPIGSRKADMDGLQLIAQWINSIDECPAPSTP